MSKQDWEACLQRVLAALPTSKAQAKIADRIHEEADTPREWRTQVHTRNLIRTLRMEGAPICSSPAWGYWLTSEPRELKECIDSLAHRAQQIDDLVAKMRETYGRMEGEKQGEMF